ncbi:MAG: exodeoxyribonuclease VII small subunit [Dermatophilaceae bacterium]
MAPDPAAGQRASQAPAEIAELSYEQARDELVAIVARLESGQAPLEESMALWERGEALAAHCTAWLDDAQARITTASETAPPDNDR